MDINSKLYLDLNWAVESGVHIQKDIKQMFHENMKFKNYKEFIPVMIKQFNIIDIERLFLIHRTCLYGIIIPYSEYVHKKAFTDEFYNLIQSVYEKEYERLETRMRIESKGNGIAQEKYIEIVSGGNFYNITARKFLYTIYNIGSKEEIEALGTRYYMM